MELTFIAPSEINEKAERTLSLAVSKENATSLEKVRTENNKYIKSVKEKIEEARQEFLKPFNALEQQALEALKPLEEANKTLTQNILEAKKTAFREKVKEYWEQIMTLDPDGLYTPFEEVYDPAWYGDSGKDWQSKLIAAIKKHNSKDLIQGCYFIIERAPKWKLDEIEAFIISELVTYRKETL